jgi:hypothetical protein
MGPILFNLKFFSPITAFATHFEAYEEWCKEHHQDSDPIKCAVVYFFQKDSANYDEIIGQSEVLFNDYTDKEKALEPNKLLSRVSKTLLYLGLLLSLLEINIDRKIMLFFIFVGSILLQVPYFWAFYNNSGVDTVAYINQAGVFLSGQNCYDKIFSLQGPCNYPAGHLWHYLPVYKLF